MIFYSCLSQEKGESQEREGGGEDEGHFLHSPLFIYLFYSKVGTNIRNSQAHRSARCLWPRTGNRGAAGVREDLWRAPASSCPQHLPRLLSHEPCSLGTSSPQSSRPPPGRVSRQRRRGSAGKGVTPLHVKG